MSGWKRLISIVGRPQLSIEDETRFHIEMRARELEAHGLTPDEALTEAERRFGDRMRFEAECRQLQRSTARATASKQWIVDLWQDIVKGARMLRREPAFAIAAITTLGLGIGANAAIYSVVDAFVFRPLAVQHSDRLLSVGMTFRDNPLFSNVDYALWDDLRALTGVFDDVVAHNGEMVALRADSQTTREFVGFASGNYFSMLEPRATIGRLWAEADDASRAPVVVISHDLWQRRFNSDPGVVGKSVSINGAPFAIIGVARKGFNGVQPLVHQSMFLATHALELIGGMSCVVEEPGCRSTRIHALIKPDIPLAQARAALADLASEVNAILPAAAKGIAFVADYEVNSRPDPVVSQRTPLLAFTFMGLVSLALLVACANVTNLLLARANARRAEIAVRRALGATAWRITRQLITEGLLIGAMSLSVAWLVAHAAISWINNLEFSVDVPIKSGIQLDQRVFWYTAAVGLFAGTLAALAPGLLGRRVELTEAMAEGGRGGIGGDKRGRLRSALVVAQVSFSLVLLICAALFTRSVRGAAALDLGFRTDSVLLASADFSVGGVSAAERETFQRTVVEQVSVLPGVISAAWTNHVPFSGDFSADVAVPEKSLAGGAPPEIETYRARSSPGFLNAIGFRLVEGRDFTEQDVAGRPRVAVINRAAAELLWPGQAALGQRVRWSDDTTTIEIVGIIHTAKYLFLNESPRPFLYQPIAQRPAGITTLVVHTRVPPATLASSVQHVFAAANPDVPAYGVRDMRSYLDHGLAFFFLRLGAALAMGIGLMGLVQTVVGLYGVLAYSVTQQRREIGIRMALGALGTSVARRVVRQGLLYVGLGMFLGLLAAAAVTRSLGTILVGTSATDWVAFVGSSVVVLLCALAASYLPARRAARVSPITSLR